MRIVGSIVLLSLLGSSPLAAQPTIDHDDVRCIPHEEFTRFIADIEPPDSVRAAKIYFRSEIYPEFYFVEMTSEAERFSAILPLPNEEKTRVVYYIEVVDNAFETARSEEFVVDVESGSACLRGPGAVAFLGANPAIVIGALESGLPALPAGFQASGVAGFLSAAGGAAAASGSGVGIGVGIGAAAGAAAGVGVLVSGGENDPEGGGAATTSAPIIGSGPSTTTTSVPAGASTTTSGPGAPPSPSTTTVPAGAPDTTTTTATTTETTTAPPPLPPGPTACFTWAPAGECKVSFDAACSAGDIETYEWTLLGTPVPPPPPSSAFTFDFSADPRCGNNTEAFNRPVRLRVFDGEGRSDTVQQNVLVPQSSGLGLSTRSTLVLSSQLLSLSAAADPTAWLSVDGSAALPVTGSARHEYRVAVSSEAPVVEGTLQSRAPAGTLWELDFSRGDSVSRLDFQVEAGTPVAVEGRRIVFRLNGDRGEKIRFRLRARAP